MPAEKWNVLYKIDNGLRTTKILSSQRNVKVVLKFSISIEIFFLLLDEKSYLLASFGKKEDVKNRVDELNRQIDVCRNCFLFFQMVFK